ncbi:hypothetical protein PLESTB_000857500 [Pleodorina starrii]|uniref:gamma-glutamylcyclotransferase n=1 Tax=Pleodorina starrii TaxID=330485 RepID=A0A9W6BLN0_9CHLO|nr:hypothetical protein PLESTM_001436400 [Pleodorina starrii]GLC54379.1 hypothetical protein PLESTB_000857500 [Pleodorina starrii]
MDRSHQCRGNMQQHSHKLHPFYTAQPPTRTCLARAHRGRAFGRAMSAWAWPGPLAWRDGSVQSGKEPSARGKAPTKAPQPTLQPEVSSQRDESPGSGRAADLTEDARASGSGNGSSTVDGQGGAGSQPWPAAPSAGTDLQTPAQQQPPPPQQQQQGPSTNTVTTFAYGANMNFLTLARREVRVLSRDPAFVVDSAVRLVFKHQGGYATLERAEDGGEQAGAQAEPRFRPYDGRIHGVLYRVTREDFAKLSKREGGYLVQELQVQTYDGSLHTALVFVSNPLFKLPEEVTPTEKYLAKVREGARDNYLDPAYQAFLSGISTVPGAGLGSEYYNTPSKYMGYSFLVVVALITLAYLFQH